MEKLNNNCNELADRIQVYGSEPDVWSVIKKMTQSDQQDCFYVCDVGEIIRRHKYLKNALPRVHPHYAVKCNGNKVVLETLAALGANFDCFSEDEIKSVFAVGVKPSQIIFANPTKKISHIQYAAAVGVDLMTFDNKSELYKIKMYHPKSKLLLRIRCDDVMAYYVLGEKFGCDVADAYDILRVASSLDLDVVGVAFHIGSGSTDFSIYTKAVEAAREIFNVGKMLGFNFNFLDIGGGFPGGNVEEDEKLEKTIMEIGSIINLALDEYFSDIELRVISEPGRFYVNTAFTLVSNIHSVRSSYQTENEDGKIVKRKTKMYYLDISVFGTLFHTLFKEFYAPKVLHENLKSHYYPSIIWGTTAHSHDKISDYIKLPELKIGDWLVFENTGAYTMAYGCEFNGFATPKVFSVIDKAGWLELTGNETLPVPNKRFIFEATPEKFRKSSTNGVLQTEIL